MPREPSTQAVVWIPTAQTLFVTSMSIDLLGIEKPQKQTMKNAPFVCSFDRLDSPRFGLSVLPKFLFRSRCKISFGSFMLRRVYGLLTFLQPSNSRYALFHRGVNHGCRFGGWPQDAASYFRQESNEFGTCGPVISWTPTAVNVDSETHDELSEPPPGIRSRFAFSDPRLNI